MTNYWKSIITELYVILLSWVELDLDLYCVLLLFIVLIIVIGVIIVSAWESESSYR